jgi:hypothetical protein
MVKKVSNVQLVVGFSAEGYMQNSGAEVLSKRNTEKIKVEMGT